MNFKKQLAYNVSLKIRDDYKKAKSRQIFYASKFLYISEYINYF